MVKMIKALIARLATIVLAYTVANAVKAGTGLIAHHQDENDDDADADADKDDGDKDGINSFFTLFIPSLPSPVWQKAKLFQIFLTFSLNNVQRDCFTLLLLLSQLAGLIKRN